MVILALLPIATGLVEEKTIPLSKVALQEITRIATGSQASATDDVRREVTLAMSMKIGNAGTREIASLTLVGEVIDGDVVLWRSKPVVLRKFVNFGMPYNGSLLPLEKSPRNPIPVRLPYRFWRTDLPVSLREIGRAHV